MFQVSRRGHFNFRRQLISNSGCLSYAQQRHFVTKDKLISGTKHAGVMVWNGGKKTFHFTRKSADILWNVAKMTPAERKEAFNTKWINLKQNIVEATHHTIKWLKTGSKLFGANVRVSVQLLKKKANGFELTRKEHALLVRTMTDCFKLVPFSFFVIVPFAELLLPVALRLFPEMLPSTFNEKPDDSGATLSRKLKAKQELAKFFQEMVRERAKQMSTTSDAAKSKYESLKEFQDKMMSRQSTDAPLLTLQEVLPFAKLFRDEFKIDNLSLTALQTICRLLGKTPYGFHSHVALQVRHHALRLQREDRQILWDGVDTLDHDELVEACKDRALKFHGVSDQIMRQQLKVWLQLSQHPDIPIVLLLWSRCIALTHKPLEASTAATADAAAASSTTATVTATPTASIHQPTLPSPSATSTSTAADAHAASAAASDTASTSAASKASTSAAEAAALRHVKAEEDRARVADAEARIQHLLEEERRISNHIKNLKEIAKAGGDVAAANKVEVVQDSDVQKASAHSSSSSTSKKASQADGKKAKLGDTKEQAGLKSSSSTEEDLADSFRAEVRKHDQEFLSKADHSTLNLASGQSPVDLFHPVSKTDNATTQSVNTDETKKTEQPPLALSDVTTVENAATIAAQLKTKDHVVRLMRRLQAELTLQREVTASQQEVLAKAASEASALHVYMANLHKSHFAAASSKNSLTATAAAAGTVTSASAVAALASSNKAKEDMEEMLSRVEVFCGHLSGGLDHAERLLNTSRLIRESDVEGMFYPPEQESDDE